MLRHRNWIRLVSGLGLALLVLFFLPLVRGGTFNSLSEMGSTRSLSNLLIESARDTRSSVAGPFPRLLEGEFHEANQPEPTILERRY